MRSGKSWLCAELMRTKSGYSDWAVNPRTIWPQWSWERLGALAMCSDPKGDKKRSLDELMRLADKRLADASDRGWADLAQYAFERSGDEVYFPLQAWLLHNRTAWPSTILQWPEQTIRDAIAMHKVLGLPHTIHDCLYAVWPLLRKDEKEVAVMLGGDPSQSMYSVLSTWGQFPYTLPPAIAGNLWREFMTAYRRKRRPLTHNPVSLIGKDPYIVAMRLEQGRF